MDRRSFIRAGTAAAGSALLARSTEAEAQSAAQAQAGLGRAHPSAPRPPEARSRW